MSKPPAPLIDQLRHFGRKTRFMLRFLLQIAGRGVLALRRRKVVVAAASYDDILEVLQSRDGVALAALPPDLATGCDPYGQPWLFHAIDFGSLAALRWLLARGAALTEDRRSRSPLQAAIERSLAVDEFDDEPEDPLPMIGLLVAAGADVNAMDGKGLRPLHIAGSLGAEAAEQVLIGLGADPALPDGLGLSALDYARSSLKQ
jgi:ankyrin repeat protein